MVKRVYKTGLIQNKKKIYVERIYKKKKHTERRHI